MQQGDPRTKHHRRQTALRGPECCRVQMALGGTRRLDPGSDTLNPGVVEADADPLIEGWIRRDAVAKPALEQNELAGLDIVRDLLAVLRPAVRSPGGHAGEVFDAGI